MAEPAIDLDRLDKLRTLVGADAFGRLAENLVADLARRLERLAQLGAAADLAALEREAHTLKGTAGSYGLSGVSALAARLEAACAGGAPDAATAALAALDAAIRASSDRLTARFGR